MKIIGVIGLGSIGLRHAKNLTRLGHHAIGYDPDKSLGDKYNCNSFDEIMDQANGIVIAAPTSLHLDYINRSSNLNSIGVFVEKPIAHKLPDDMSMFDYVDMVGYNLRFHECVKKAKEWLEATVIGRPLWANFTLAQYSEKPPYLRDGVILNWSHEIDLALHLLGPAKVAGSSVRLTEGKDDMADILLEHGNGCRSTVHLDYVTEPEIRQTIIVGEGGAIILDLVNHTAWLRDSGGSHIEQFEAADGWDQTYIDEMEAFIDRIDGKETIGCTAEEALQVLDICLTVRKQAGLE